MEGVEISFASESDIHKWHVLLSGPKESVYAVGVTTFLLFYNLFLLLPSSSYGEE